MVSTNIPASEVDRFVQLALKARGQKVSTLSLVPPMINTADPDIRLIRAKVPKAIDQAEGKPTGKVRKKATTETGGSLGSLTAATPPTSPTTSALPADEGSATASRVVAVPATPSDQPDGQPDDRRIVAVVVTFNRLALLQGLVARLRRTPGLAEVLVVDNASTDGTGEWLRRRDGRRPRAHAGRRTAAAPAGSTTAWSGRSSAAPTWSG